MFTEYITTWAIKANFKNHDFYILILCIVRQIWASWYPKVPIRSTWATSTSRWASTTKQLNITGWLLIRSGCLLEFHLHVWRKFCQVPNTHKTMRIKIMHNIGVLFVKMGKTCFFIPLLVKGIVRTFSLSLCRPIQRCLLLFWMDHVRAGTLSSSSFCGGTTFSHALTQKGQFLPPKRPPNIFPPKPGRLQNRPPLDLVLLRHRRQRQDEEGLHPACGDSAWGLKFPLMRQWPFRFDYKSWSILLRWRTRTSISLWAMTPCPTWFWRRSRTTTWGRWRELRSEMLLLMMKMGLRMLMMMMTVVLLTILHPEDFPRIYRLFVPIVVYTNNVQFNIP